MLNQTELKTFIPAIVAPCILFYESVSGNHLSSSTESALTNGIVIGVSLVVSLWGAYKNHQKSNQKGEVTPPKIPPDNGVNIIEETQPAKTPVVSQADYNKQIQG